MAINRLFQQDAPGRLGELSVRGIGIDVTSPAGLVHRATGSGDFLFMFLLKRGWLSENGRSRPQPPQSLMLWTPGQHQCFGDPEKPYSTSWIHCDGQQVHRIIQELALPVDQVISPADGSLFKEMLRAIYEELTSNVEPDSVIVGNHLENWMRQLARSLRRQQQPDPIPHLLLELKNHLDTTFMQPHRLEDLARRVHLSASHLCNLFKKHFRVSPIHYLICARLNHAKYLLRDRNLTVSQIAQQVGYEDLFHFSKLFKKHYTISPRQMRRQLKQRAEQ